MNNIDELKKIKEDAWDAYDKARTEYNNAMSKKYKEKYEGKFIRWADIANGESKYMFVINIWNSIDNDGPVKIPVLYFEGVYFTGYISEYIDSTYFVWDQYQQVKFQIYDFNEDTLEYKRDIFSGKSLMEIITKDEFITAFTDLNNSVINEHINFEYSAKNIH